MSDPATAHVWPLFGLVVRTPKLELRCVTDDLLEQLAPLTADVMAPGAEPFDGDASFYDPTPAGRRRWLTNQWAARAKTSPSWWVLVFAVIIDGEPAGTQEIGGVDFARLRTVSTFSWLARRYQRRGFGQEMRAAALHLAFEGLGAARAESDAFEDNAASIGVSRALGYEPNGTTWGPRPSGAAPMTRFLMTRDRWLQRRRDDIAIEGLAPCLPLLGL